MSSKGQLILWYIIAFTLIGVTIFTSLSTIGFAAHEDFTASSQYKTINMCSCGLSSETITIKNMGDVTSVYEVSQEGEPAKWSTLSKTKFTLKPGEKQEIQHFIKVPCKAEGNYKLSLQIKTLFETTKLIEQDIKVSRCNNIGLVPVKNFAAACPAKPILFEFILANTGSHPEAYSLAVEPKETKELKNAEEEKALKSMSLSEKEIFLMPKQKKKVLIFSQMASEVYGKAEFKLLITAKNNALTAEMPFNYIINKCYDYAILLPQNIRFCTEYENHLPFEIRNNADFYNTYDVNAEIIGQQDDVYETYSIGEYGLPGKVRRGINAALPVESEPGNYYIGVDAVSVLGEIERYSETPLQITYCDERGNPLTEEQYNALQEALNAEPAEPEQTAEAAAENEEADYTLIYIVMILLALILGLLGTLLVIKKNKDSKYKLMPFDFTATQPQPEELDLLGKKKRRRKLLIIGITGLLFLIILSVLLFMILSMIMVPADEEGTQIIEESTETTDAEEIEEIPPAETQDTAKDTSDAAEEETAEEETEGLTLLEWIVGISTLLLFLGIMILILILILRMKKKKSSFTETDEKQEEDKKEKKKEDKEDKKDAKNAKEAYHKISLKTRITDLAQSAKKKINWKKMALWGLVIIILLLLIGSTAFLVSLLGQEEKSNALSIEQLSKEQMQENGILDINGNTVSIEKGKEAAIPLVFRNDGEAQRIVDLDFEIPWLKTSSKELAIEPAEEEQTTVRITDEAPEGKYKIVFQITDADGSNPTEEVIYINIVVPVSKLVKTIVISTLAFLLLAIVLILLLILLIKRRKKKAQEKTIEIKNTKIEKFVKKDIKQDLVPPKKVVYVPTPEELELKAMKKEARKAKLKKFAKNALFVFAILMVIGLLALGLFALSKHYAPQETPEIVDTLEIETDAPLRYTINDVSKLTIVPFRIINKDPKATYEIVVDNKEDWISFDKEKIEIAPDSSEMLEMTIHPDQIKEGSYNINMRMNQKEGNKEMYNSEIFVNINKKGIIGTAINAVKAYWLYMLLGIASLIALLFLIIMYYKKERKQSLQELAAEAMRKERVETKVATKKGIMHKKSKSEESKKSIVIASPIASPQKKKSSKYRFKRTDISFDAK